MRGRGWPNGRRPERLADDRGFDGFTMDELAAAAAVSRRTLFNHVSGKLEAVLGPPAAQLLPHRGGAVRTGHQAPPGDG